MREQQAIVITQDCKVRLMHCYKAYQCNKVYSESCNINKSHADGIPPASKVCAPPHRVTIACLPLNKNAHNQYACIFILSC